MRLFWERGYEGASMAELTAVMEIGSPSLYAAFGSKEALFREAVELYRGTAGSLTGRALASGGTAREAVERALRDNAASYAEHGHPKGCLVVLAAFNCSNQAVRDHLADARRQGRDQIRQRLLRGVAEGDVPAGVDVDGLATFYTAVLSSLSLEARDGATARELGAVVDGAMAAWPERTPAP
ncbi:TetR family transcriptional regulator [Umezawaea tangerina]|uniref:TetR family transcriptional regulator n=2 Tax=Umezawaea tangerina TaxID=84725 RepID=A0A2T0SZD7_9PSEU|nr:TetR family transcriptional regulator [Umezawaea tangerina]